MIYYKCNPRLKATNVIDPVLNNNSWATIQKAAQNGTASSYWNVGDRKEVILNGTVGAKTFSNKKVYVYILGFNHNAEKEGDNTIHFQFGFNALTGGTHIAFCDSSYNSSGSSSAFRMNTTNANSGWSSTHMRGTICPALINAMPSDLRGVLKMITKYTNNVGQSSAESAVWGTSEKVFLLAEYEIFGKRSRANQYEQNYQLQYDYYKNGGAKVMYNDTSTSSAVIWWSRSPYYANSQGFCLANGSGIQSSQTANYSYGFAPAFAVG